jgi:hypothetical protein
MEPVPAASTPAASQKRILRLISDQSKADAPPAKGNAGTGSQVAPAALDAMFRHWITKQLFTMDEERVIAWIDAEVLRPAETRPFLHPLVHAVEGLPLPPEARQDFLKSLVAVRLSEPAQAFANDAFAVHASTLETTRRVLASITRPKRKKAHQATDSNPLAYLHEMPVALARLVLAYERGLVAAIGVDALLGITPTYSPPEAPLLLGRDVFLARLWSDGMRSLARAIASIFPELESQESVSAADRLDMGALTESQAAADALIEKRYREARASGKLVFPPLPDHDD